jgi:hypothetical protein
MNHVSKMRVNAHFLIANLSTLPTHFVNCQLLICQLRLPIAYRFLPTAYFFFSLSIIRILPMLSLKMFFDQ